jgi:acetate CoA/acetoacetate CoA-transferase alpha subunit
MYKLADVDQAMEHVKDGMTVMIGGFMGTGTPEILIDGLVKKGIKNLTLIANDTAMPGRGIGKLISNKQIKKLIASHIGLNPETGIQMHDGILEVELVPQGTLAERIRAGGAGLGGFLTPTGIGTDVEAGKQKMNVNGKDYLLELPLHADVALIRGSIVDKKGNVYYEATTQNFNSLMATAADVVICGAEKIVETGELDPNCVRTQGILVNFVVGGEPCWQIQKP